MVELLAVLVIIAVLVALVAPSISGMLASDRAESAVNRMASDIMQARMEAVRSGRRVEVIMTNGTYTVVRSASGAEAADTLKRVYLTNEFPGMTFRPTSATMAFDSRGLLSGDSDVGIEVSRGDVSRSITVSVVGNIYRD